jgi:hypothetical protein
VSRSSWKVKNVKKHFLPEKVKTKREGIVCKILEINAKHDYSISEHVNMLEYTTINYKVHA